VKNCSNCGEGTRLFVSHVPWCVACFEAGPEKRKVRSLTNSGARREPVEVLPTKALGGGAALAQLVPEAQKVLIALLQVDLDLSETLLETAEISTSRTHSESALERVVRTLQTVRQLGTKVDDPVARADIRNRADGIELRAETFPV
jgi:hypothetical protein